MSGMNTLIKTKGKPSMREDRKDPQGDSIPKITTAPKLSQR